jgi:hypothetical protein
MRIWSRLAHPATMSLEVGTSRDSNLKIEHSISSSLVRLDSDLVHSIQYSHENQTLYVYFRVGRLYEYRDVPSELYQEFVRAGSRENFFDKNIRRSFTCKRLSDTWVGESG